MLQGLSCFKINLILTCLCSDDMGWRLTIPFRFSLFVSCLSCRLLIQLKGQSIFSNMTGVKMNPKKPSGLGHVYYPPVPTSGHIPYESWLLYPVVRLILCNQSQRVPGDHQLQFKIISHNRHQHLNGSSSSKTTSIFLNHQLQQPSLTIASLGITLCLLSITI